MTSATKPTTRSTSLPDRLAGHRPRWRTGPVALLLLGLGAGLAAPAQAANTRDAVLCTLVVEYQRIAGAGTVSGTVTHSSTFSVTPGAPEPYFEDFGTALRLRDFTASIIAGPSEALVQLDLFADVGVFDSIGFSLALPLPNNRKSASIAGTQDHFSSLNGSVRHHTSYTLGCNR